MGKRDLESKIHTKLVSSREEPLEGEFVMLLYPFSGPLELVEVVEISEVEIFVLKVDPTVFGRLVAWFMSRPSAEPSRLEPFLFPCPELPEQDVNILTDLNRAQGSLERTKTA